MFLGFREFLVGGFLFFLVLDFYCFEIEEESDLFVGVWGLSVGVFDFFICFFV